MNLYNFLIQNRKRFMNELIERNKKSPQQWYDRFFFPDNCDLKKLTMAICAQGRVYSEAQEEKKPETLAEKICNIGRKTLKLGQKALGHDIQSVKVYDAWLGIMCRDQRHLERVGEEIRIEKWNEVKDPQTIEAYKGVGQRFYELDRWVLVLFSSQQENTATLIYRPPEQFGIKEYHHQVYVMLEWITRALEPLRQVQKVRPPKKPELKVYDLYAENNIQLDESHQATFAIRADGEKIEAGLVIGNAPDITHDQINAYLISIDNRDYLAAAGNGQLAIVKRLHGPPSEREAIDIKTEIINYGMDFLERLKTS